jgi:hypothetical protein
MILLYWLFNTLPCVKSAFTRRTSGHSLGPFRTLNFFGLSPPPPPPIIIIMIIIIINTEVTANRPDITIKNKKEKTCTLIDVAIPADRNVVQKEAEKKLKYKSLCIEIQRMWNLKCTIIPVIIGATGIVTRTLRKNLEAVPGKHSINSLQKTAILGTSHIIRKVLHCEA